MSDDRPSGGSSKDPAEEHDEPFAPPSAYTSGGYPKAEFDTGPGNEDDYLVQRAAALVGQMASHVADQRKAQELTQRDLADLAGVSQSTVSDIENGRRWGNTRTVAKLLAALDSEIGLRRRPRS